MTSPAVALAAILVAAPALAQEYTRFETLAVTPAARAGEPAGCTSMALLNLPPGWDPGDAAVVMLAPWQDRDPARDRLVGALLHEQAAVLELGIGPCPGKEAEAPASPLAEAMGALLALREAAGAGMVVAIGYGSEARRMLDAVQESEARARIGDGPRFAAAASFGDGSARFILGPPQPRREHAPARLAMLCDALAGVAGGVAEALRDQPAVTATLCRTAFAGPTVTRASASFD